MPWQFWDLTPREVVLQARGFEWRQEQDNWRMAEIVATLMNPILTLDADPKKVRRSRKRVTAADVLGKKLKKRPGARTPEEQLQVFRQLTTGMGGTIKTSPRKSPDSTELSRRVHRTHQD